MVGKGQTEDILRVRFEIDYHLLGRRYAGEQKHMSGRRDAVQGTLLATEHRAEVVIDQRGEEELLVRKEVHCLGDDTKLHGLEVARTLGDDHDIGAVLAFERFAEASCWQQLVVDDETVIIHEEDIYARLHVAVLEGVVEKDDVNVGYGGTVCETAYAVDAVAVHSYGDVAKLGLHLHWFVADVACGALAVGDDESA